MFLILLVLGIFKANKFCTVDKDYLSIYLKHIALVSNVKIKHKTKSALVSNVIIKRKAKSALVSNDKIKLKTKSALVSNLKIKLKTKSALSVM